MRCDIVFFRLKRLRFEKIKKNEFRPDYGKMGRTQRLKIRNLNSICVRLSKRTKTSRYFFLKDKVFSYQKQAVTYLETPSRKNCHCLLSWYSQLRNTIQRYFSTCTITPNSLKLRQCNVSKSAWVLLRVVFEGPLKKLHFNVNISQKETIDCCVLFEDRRGWALSDLVLLVFWAD